MMVELKSKIFRKSKIFPNINNAINIPCVYKLDPIASTRDTSYAIQNALFRAMQLIKIIIKIIIKDMVYVLMKEVNFGHTVTENGRAHTTNGGNVLIFGADMSFSTHATNRSNHLFLMGDGLTQGINDTTIYAEKKYWRNFTDPGKKFVLSLHYNGNDSYLFVNGRQELKFKCKKDQSIK